MPEQELLGPESGLPAKTDPNTIIETASTASAEMARAEIQSQYAIAVRFPRDILSVRLRLLDACKRPRFADKALYRKPVGKSSVVGPSIRFAEEAIRSMGNIRVTTSTSYEDDNQRKVKVNVTDLETNATYSQEITVNKTVERKDNRGRDVVGTRVNSYGDPVFIVKATDDELTQKEAALVSKVIRNEGLRLLPSDIIEEAIDEITNTMKSGMRNDPKAEMKKIMDAFHGVGVEPKHVEKLLGHALDYATDDELVRLREIYQTIRDGEATLKSYLDQANDAEKKPEAETMKSGKGKKGTAKKGSSKKTTPPPEPPPPEEPPPEGDSDGADDLPFD